VISDRRDGELSGPIKVSVRPLEQHGRVGWQLTRYFGDRATHENLDSPSAIASVAAMLGGHFAQATLHTPQADTRLCRLRDGQWRATALPSSKVAGSTGHDRPKKRLIPEGSPCPFLEAIGVMTPEGRVRRASYHKFRQVNRFLELVDDITGALPEGRVLRVVDFGCGKSYLTFAIHYLLTRIHERSVEVTGLDLKADVIDRCREIAAKLGCAGLEFHQGDIARFETRDPVDLVVSLHACDKATDLALARAVRWKSASILAVPCCQHELAPQMTSAQFAPLTGHGILREQFAALSTDALRALLLEAAGYKVQVVEFIDLEHTAKNLLIRGVRRGKDDPHLRKSRYDEYTAFKRLLGVESFCLERELGEILQECRTGSQAAP
jgi:SAM-dependent methyltransferase